MNHQQELKKLIDIVIAEGGSDLHFTAGQHPSIRVTGDLVSLVKHPVFSHEDVQKIASILIPESRLPGLREKHEIDFSHTTEQGVRFRGNAYFQQEGLSIALRLIPAKIRSLSELNLPEVLMQFARRKQGFFLVTGPVGHGKTTTLASLLEIINTERAEHILTIEDPIEYLFEPKQSVVDQREVGVDTNSFRAALRSMFRQDIDVAMIGEMRGIETISAAVTAAETGHLVLSTLHTNNSAQTVDRIIDSFPSEQQNQIRGQLSQSLAGIFSQRLLPRVSGGLIPAYELVLNTSAVSNLIRENRTHEINIVIETGSSEGMVDMNRVLFDLINRGEITYDTARAYSMNPEGLNI